MPLRSANYAIVVRSSEFNLPQEMLDDIVAQATLTFHENDLGGGDYGRYKHRRRGNEDDVVED